MDVGTGHWMFAMAFAVVFVVAIFKAYSQDQVQSPSYFSGSSKFLLSVLLIVMVLVVVKILSRMS